MSAISRFVNSFFPGGRAEDNDDDIDDENDMDNENDYYDDEEDYDDEDAPRPRQARSGGFVSRFRRPSRNEMPEDDYDDEEDEDPAPRASSRGTGIVRSSGSPANSRRSSGNEQIFLIKPTSFNDVQAIADTLLKRRAVMLNLERLDQSLQQRVIDFAYGSCYTIRGTFVRVSHYIFVITPPNIGVSGDISMGDDDQDPGSSYGFGPQNGGVQYPNGNMNGQGGQY